MVLLFSVDHHLEFQPSSCKVDKQPTPCSKSPLKTSMKNHSAAFQITANVLIYFGQQRWLSGMKLGHSINMQWRHWIILFKISAMITGRLGNYRNFRWQFSPDSSCSPLGIKRWHCWCHHPALTSLATCRSSFFAPKHEAWARRSRYSRICMMATRCRPWLQSHRWQ